MRKILLAACIALASGILTAFIVPKFMHDVWQRGYIVGSIIQLVYWSVLRL